MKRTQVLIAITLADYIVDRREALEEAEYVAKLIERDFGYNTYAIDADTIEVEE